MNPVATPHTNRGTLLKEKQLANCLMIKLEGPCMKEFSPDKAVDLWFQKVVRRPGKSASQEDEASHSASRNLNDEAQYEVLLIEEDNTVGENNDNIQPAAAAVVQAGDVYGLVQEPDDSDYESD